MTFRLRDLMPGDVVEHKSGFSWRVLRVEPVSRMLLWKIVVRQPDLVKVDPPARWSPPHTVEEWCEERDGEVRREARVA